MDGNIKVKSTQNEGSIFKITFPYFGEKHDPQTLEKVLEKEVKPLKKRLKNVEN